MSYRQDSKWLNGRELEAALSSAFPEVSGHETGAPIPAGRIADLGPR